MKQPTKLDFFVVSFMSAIINSAKKAPVLIDQTETSKRMSFITDNGEFNIFIKYSTTIRHSAKKVGDKVKSKMTCDISFNDKEYNILSGKFEEHGKSNYVVAVCTNNKFNDNYIVVIPFDIAMKCLQDSNQSHLRRITITRMGKEGTYKCYGIGGKITQADSVFYDWHKYL